ncbi:MAG: Peptide methionine sulfoxide reductase MsrA [Candidatus Jettenia ecosi]|uniref:Peptide methionine sulfoxide reductase MsrA n=1 Tax=Candidatus Jettenia ecosi TaxID=2494326 RepID=A0A533Q6U3_9BACT|nr:MAG: Peptide methionine sulfoxide reductase MsrA [Candidatus Jettenia ecosi]
MKYIIYILCVISYLYFLNIDSKAQNGGQMRSTLPVDNGKEIATLAGGCFWCLEALFLELRGVGKVESGYSGGNVPNPSYDQVCTGTTGHAEVIQITFDPTIISFRELLEVFFTIHDPTTLNRQGADVGTQYRSAIFYHTQEQRKVAEHVMKEFSEAKIWDAPMVTEIKAFTAFYRAEEYHQGYYKRNPEQPYCRIVIEPKVAKLRKQYRAKLKK